MDVLIGRNLGQYRIVEKIGKGGMATVYKAFQPTLDRYVAIKVLPPIHAENPEFGERFEREAKAVAQLNHPNIVPIHDFGQDGNYRFLVMRYIDGATTLKDVMKTSLGLTQITDLIGQVAAALAHAHERGIIHRDVKPSNVMMDGQWALLTDFGLARMAEVLVELTGSGVGVGTPAYMSPEQGRGLPVDHRSDIYSLGILLFEMLTGQIPHNADTPFAIVFRRITEPLPLPRTLNPEIPEKVEQVVLKSLATEPDHRFESTEEMTDALRQAAAGENLVLGIGAAAGEDQKTNALPTQAVMTAFLGPPPTKVGHAPKKRPQVPLWVMLTALVVAGALVGLAAFWAGRGNFFDAGGSVPTATTVASIAEAVTTPTGSPTVTETALATATHTEAIPTMTPAPVVPTKTQTPTRTPSPIASATNTPTPAPTPTATAVPATKPPPTKTATREETVAEAIPDSEDTLLLLQPLPPDDPEFTASYGPTVFEWTYDGPLADDQGFEVRVWQEGEPPAGAHNAVEDNRNGGVTSPSPNTYQVNIDISDVPGVRGRTGDYLWTVLLIEIDPEYKELSLQATPGQLRYEAPGGGHEDGGGGGSQPTF